MPATSAQVSLYPLGREDLSTAIDQALKIFRKHDLAVRPGPMSTLILGDHASVFGSLQEAYGHLAEQGPLVLVATFSNSCPVD
jgi:uncharacterized protein YqgV (UPF0045/DUF77 family)